MRTARTRGRADAWTRGRKDALTRAGARARGRADARTRPDTRAHARTRADTHVHARTHGRGRLDARTRSCDGTCDQALPPTAPLQKFFPFAVIPVHRDLLSSQVRPAQRTPPRVSFSARPTLGDAVSFPKVRNRRAHTRSKGEAFVTGIPSPPLDS